MNGPGINLKTGAVVRAVTAIGRVAKPGMLGTVAQEAIDTGWYKIRWLNGQNCAAYPEEIEAVYK